VIAKGLGAGMAIGALIATDKASQAFTPGSHGSTFGGNPLACAAGLAALDTLLEDNIIIPAVEQLGRHFMEGLAALKKKYGFIKGVRGKGLLIGIELDFEGKTLSPPVSRRASSSTAQWTVCCGSCRRSSSSKKRSTCFSMPSTGYSRSGN
jgi:acetylornithine/succinyldiaminopimelate/putrescine aminotransferase